MDKETVFQTIQQKHHALVDSHPMVKEIVFLLFHLVQTHLHHQKVHHAQLDIKKMDTEIVLLHMLI